MNRTHASLTIPGALRKVPPNKRLELTEVTDRNSGGGSASDTRLLNYNLSGSGTIAVKWKLVPPQLSRWPLGGRREAHIMIDPDDPRLATSNDFLAKYTWRWKTWIQTRNNWDHDHCEFCGAKFMARDLPNILREGYTTDDDYYWICKKCFEDFDQTYHWKVVP